jgi:hypothetical protein
MKLKKFSEFYIKENIVDDDDDGYEKKWELKINNETDSYWEYKSDAIDRVLELLETEGSEIDGFEDEDGEGMSSSEVCDMLCDLNEIEFYEKLEELKNFTGYDEDIRIINIADEDELEFLETEKKKKLDKMKKNMKKYNF